jgi:WD40 repeat protein
MDQPKTPWIAKIALACAMTGPSLAIDLLAQETTPHPHSVAVESANNQLLIRLAPLEMTSKYPPVVTAIGCSQDSKWMVAAGDDHAIRVVQLADGKTVQTLQGHTDWVQGVSIVDENQRIISCSKDCTLRIWSASDQWTSKILHQSDIALMALATDPSNEFVACAGFGPHIWVYSLVDGTLQKTITCECGDQRTLAFSSDGHQLACGGRDGVVRVWEWQTDRQPLEQILHQDRIRSISFSENNTVISTVGEDRRFVRYQLHPGKILVERRIVGGRLLSMTNIDADTIAVAGSDNTIRLIEINTGNEINRLHGHDGSVAVMVRSGGQLVSGSFDTTIRTWDLSRAMQKNKGNYEHPVSARFQDSGAGEAVR